MAQLAAARADEIGASILWCDGGSGGVSGVYGYGTGRGLQISQRGNGGTFIKYIGVPNPFEPREKWKTMFGKVGNLGSLFVIWGLVWVGALVESRFSHRRGSEHGGVFSSIRGYGVRVITAAKGGFSGVRGLVTGASHTARHDVEAAAHSSSQQVGRLVDTD